MLKRHLWKIVFSIAIAVWGISELLPLQDAPSFAQFAKEQATAKPADFAKLVDEATARKKAGTAASEFVALKQIGKEKKIDLSQYFPDVRLEATLKNVEKRNNILLNELLRRSKARLQLGLDLAGGVSVTLEVDEKALKPDSEEDQKEKITKAIEIIHNRIDSFGVSEPIIRAVGANRIEIQMPGLNTKDDPGVLDAIKKPARLDFRVVNPSLSPGPGVDTPAGYEILTLEDEGRNGEIITEELFERRIPEMSGDKISNSSARPDIYGKPEVVMNFTKEGRKRFAEVTRSIADGGQQSGRTGRLAIVLDGKLYSAPTVKQEIDSESAQISGGNMSDREAIQLANVLNNPLAVQLVVKEQYEVGPSLAKDAVDSGVRSAIIGTALVAAFMITFYTTGGLVAVATLAINILIILGIMASFGATMTLPGLAGIVLTIGMAVDSNVIIFERIRDEIRTGASRNAAVSAGFDKAFGAIFDANVTTLLAGILLYYFGTGAIRGFAVTLSVGVLTTLFCAVFVARLCFDALELKGKQGLSI